ncbi:MAG: class II glutamine amidotransferase [Rhodospirillales bacterium]
MCRWVAYAGPPVFLDSLIFEPEHSLIHQSREARQSKSAINADGFGVGWYASRSEPGIFKDIQPAWNDENLKNLANQISSPLFFAHVRASTGTAASRSNCHPFRHGRWMFMHNGQIGGHEQVRRDLLLNLAPESFRSIRGGTDSELMFMMMVDNGLDRDPEGALAKTVGTICDVMNRANVVEPLKLTVAFSNGEMIYAARFASHGEPPSLYYNLGVEIENAQGRAPCGGGDAVMVVSEPLDAVESHWVGVQESHIIVAGCGAVSTRPFEPVCAA